MSSVQKYFNFNTYIACGIPEVSSCGGLFQNEAHYMWRAWTLVNLDDDDDDDDDGYDDDDDADG